MYLDGGGFAAMGQLAHDGVDVLDRERYFVQILSQFQSFRNPGFQLRPALLRGGSRQLHQQASFAVLLQLHDASLQLADRRGQ